MIFHDIKLTDEEKQRLALASLDNKNKHLMLQNDLLRRDLAAQVRLNTILLERADRPRTNEVQHYITDDGRVSTDPGKL